MIVFRAPKGWTGPKEVDGKQVEGSFRAHQVPIAMDNPEHLVQLEEWLRSYHPEELFDDSGTLIPELQALAPKGQRRMGANPHANGGLLLRELRRTNPDIEKSIFHSIHSVCLDTMVGYKSGGVEHTFADCYRERGEMAEMEKEDAE